jgi:hypothetical protein
MEEGFDLLPERTQFCVGVLTLNVSLQCFVDSFSLHT